MLRRLSVCRSSFLISHCFAVLLGATRSSPLLDRCWFDRSVGLPQPDAFHMSQLRTGALEVALRDNPAAAAAAKSAAVAELLMVQCACLAAGRSLAQVVDLVTAGAFHRYPVSSPLPESLGAWLPPPFGPPSCSLGAYLIAARLNMRAVST